jgi:hypothetical protein
MQEASRQQSSQDSAETENGLGMVVIVLKVNGSKRQIRILLSLAREVQAGGSTDGPSGLSSARAIGRCPRVPTCVSRVGP